MRRSLQGLHGLQKRVHGRFDVVPDKGFQCLPAGLSIMEAIDDTAMDVQGFFEIVLIIAKGVAMPQGVHAQSGEQGDEDLVAGCVDENLVQYPVMGGKFLKVVLPGGVLHNPESRFHLLEFLPGQVGVSQGGRQSLKLRPDRKIIPDVLGGDPFHEDPLTGQDFHQPVFVQDPEGFPQGGPADPEFLFELFFVEPVPALEGPGEDPFGQALSDLIHQTETGTFLIKFSGMGQVEELEMALKIRCVQGGLLQRCRHGVGHG